MKMKRLSTPILLEGRHVKVRNILYTTGTITGAGSQQSSFNRSKGRVIQIKERQCRRSDGLEELVLPVRRSGPARHLKSHQQQYVTETEIEHQHTGKYEKSICNLFRHLNL